MTTRKNFESRVQARRRVALRNLERRKPMPVPEATKLNRDMVRHAIEYNDRRAVEIATLRSRLGVTA